MTNPIKASFDLTTVQGQMKAFNAQNGASVSLKTLEHAQLIDVVGVMQHEEVTDTYGKEQLSVVTTLFGADGASYAGVSDTVAKAGEKLIQFLQQTGLEKVTVMIVKQRSAKGNEFLNLQLVG